MAIKCCVPGCDTYSGQGIKLHRFPYLDEDVYTEYIRRIGNNKLLNLSPIDVYKSYRVCDKHFSEHSRIPEQYKHKSGLIYRSLPTLYLPDFNEEPTKKNSILPFPNLLDMPAKVTCWVPGSSGQVPPNAFVGGEDNGEPMYVARGFFNNSQVPGKLLSSHGCCYVPWGGKENPLNNYEVLCDFNGSWVDCSGGNVPPNAVTAGESEDGEPLYVGRVFHDGSLSIGKVHQSHGVCYIPYGGEELPFQDYQILVAY